MKNIANSLIELNESEQREINGGSERDDKKRENWFGSIWYKIIGILN